MSEDILTALVKVIDETEMKTIGRIGHDGREGGAHFTPRWILKTAVDEIARLREERRWIPVGERLPELNEANGFRVYCLAYCKGGSVCEMAYEINHYAKQERHRQPRWKWWGTISMREVTHWQPLPPGPEAAG